MQLIGRIDRVDKAEDENGTYLRIIDYKSSAKELNLTEVYYGVALQMLTYLDIILHHSNVLIGKEATPAGVLYFHVHNPILNAKKIMTMEDIENELFKKFKMNGLILGEENAVRLMDYSIEAGSTSQIVPAKVNKDGSFAKHSKIASQQEFKEISDYLHHLYVKTGNAITEGNVAISPYKLKRSNTMYILQF